MKRIIIFLSTTIFCHSTFSQVQFEPISFDQALSKAKETGRMIFLQFESATCEQCNEVADKAFEDKKLGSRLKDGFISIRISPKNADRNNVAGFYDKESFFGSLFISSDGALIHTFPQTTSMADGYFKQIDLALTKAGEGSRLNEFEKQYRNNNKNIFLAEQILLLRKDLYLNTDTLLDEYVTLLPQDSLQSPEVITFIVQQYPVIGSKADRAIRKDYSLFNKAWNKLSLPVRVGINNRIISRSLRKAIREKNLDYAYRVASFARSTHTSNAKAGNNSYDAKILEFYRETHDTLNYLVRVINYYDSYYMTVNVDSVMKKDSLNRVALFEKQAPEKSNRGDSVVYKKTIAFSPAGQVFTRGLNEGAWTIYTWTKDPLYLQKALQWASRANEFFFESPEAMDTYARLLYKTGEKSKAVEWESKAIDLKKKRGYKATEYEKVLANMKSGKPVIDN